MAHGAELREADHRFALFHPDAAVKPSEDHAKRWGSGAVLAGLVRVIVILALAFVVRHGPRRHPFADCDRSTRVAGSACGALSYAAQPPASARHPQAEAEHRVWICVSDVARLMHVSCFAKSRELTRSGICKTKAGA